MVLRGAGHIAFAISMTVLGVANSSGAEAQQRSAVLFAEPAIAEGHKNDFTVSESSKDDKVFSPAPPARSNGFFKKNAAQTTFGHKLAWDKAPPLEYFPVVRRMEDEMELEEGAKQPTRTEDASKKKFLPTAESIIEEYGNPTGDAHVLAQPDAPAPFKGLMAALEIGNEKLAYQFARQWARYISSVNQRTMMVTGLTGLAMKREGHIDDGTWADDPQFKQYRHLLDEDLQEQKSIEARKPAASVARLDQKANELLQRARYDLEEEAVPAANGFTNLTTPQDEERIERQKARGQFSGSVPLDPEGKVAIFFFLRLRDNNSLAMAPAIEALYRSVATDARITFTAVSLESVSADEVRSFQAKTSTTFPITQGEMLAQAFNVRSSPTSVFVTATTNAAVTNEGVRSFFYLDELLNAMRGGQK